MPVTDYKSILETSAVISTVLQFLSGSIVCHKYVGKKSTGDSSGFPFLCGFLSCSFWLIYGILTNVRSVVLVNTIGVTTFFIYSLIYYVFTINKQSYVKQFSLIIIVLFSVIYFTNSLATDHDQAVKIMGVACSIVTVCFFAAPLTMLLHVIRIQNSESLPFPLIAMSFLVSVQWLILGVIISDSFIQITNFLGCLLSLSQLCLFVIYPPKSFSGQGYKLVDQSVVY